MTSRTRRPARAGLAMLTSTLLAATLLVAGGAGSPSYADGETQPPVAVDDAVTIYRGVSTAVPVLANDTDPQGADLTVCRTTQPERTDVQVSVLDGQLWISVDPTAFGTATFSYYACNFTYLTPATVTVEFKAIQPLVVRKADEPHKIRVTNPNPERVVFLWSPRQHLQFQGRPVRGGATRTFTIHHRWIVWLAFFDVPQLNGPVGEGQLRHLDPAPGGDTRAPIGLRRLAALSVLPTR